MTFRFMNSSIGWPSVGCPTSMAFSLHCTFLLCAGAGENAPHAVVSFVARVLENRSWGARQGNLYRPGLCESLRVVYRKLVLERVRIEPPKALRQDHGRPGTAERVLL